MHHKKNNLHHKNKVNIYTVWSRKFHMLCTRKVPHHSKETLHSYIELCTNKMREKLQPRNNPILHCIKLQASVSQEVCHEKAKPLKPNQQIVQLYSHSGVDNFSWNFLNILPLCVNSYMWVFLISLSNLIACNLLCIIWVRPIQAVVGRSASYSGGNRPLPHSIARAFDLILPNTCDQIFLLTFFSLFVSMPDFHLSHSTLNSGNYTVWCLVLATSPSHFWESFKSHHLWVVYWWMPLRFAPTSFYGQVIECLSLGIAVGFVGLFVVVWGGLCQ